MMPITVRYRKSSEKWKGIREFAKANDLDTAKIDAMISRIKIKGDAELKFEEVFKITDLDDLFDSIHAGEHPCPHCAIYSCNECPLDDDSVSCCREWAAVRKQLYRWFRR
jgi:hypothetical protein